MIKGQALLDAIRIPRIHHGRRAQTAPALGALACNRWRLPACARSTLPRAVILNRLATDFFVLTPLGRRIVQLSFKKERAL